MIIIGQEAILHITGKVHLFSKSVAASLNSTANVLKRHINLCVCLIYLVWMSCNGGQVLKRQQRSQTSIKPGTHSDCSLSISITAGGGLCWSLHSDHANAELSHHCFIRVLFFSRLLNCNYIWFSHYSTLISRWKWNVSLAVQDHSLKFTKIY